MFLLPRIRIACLVFVMVPAVAGGADRPDAKEAGGRQGTLLKAAFQGPMQGVQEVVFCTRLPYDDPHWYANIGYYCDDENQVAYPGNGKQLDTGRLAKWNVRTGQVTALVDDPGGSIRDPQVDYEGTRVLFSWRKAGTRFFHLYEIRVDGTGLRAITSGEYDDYEPTYLADGGIAFVSTRCKRWVNCWMTQVGIIYRCDADGSNVTCISANTEHDNTPWPLPDGRILYTRWEYVDRSQVEFHHLWVMNPDGTSQVVYYGNMHPGVLMIDAKPIPGTDQIIASFSPGHGANEHGGIATIVSPKLGPDDPNAVRPIHKGKRTRDPYAVSADCFLAARDDGIVLFDGKGGEELIFRYEGEGKLHEPRPVMKRAREANVASRNRPDAAVGQLVLADVNQGRNLPGVGKGEIKKLLVLESLPKPVNFSGGPDLTSWLGTFTLERVLGTVPVEEDGSASFEVPPGRQLFFVALDEHDLAVKRMQSFTSVMPGEVQSCVGCHEDRTQTPDFGIGRTLMALERPPSRIEPFSDYPDVLDFQRDVQPILDRQCVACHNPEKREGRVTLAGDQGVTWSHSYFSLLAHRQVADGRNGLGNQPPRSIGSSASPLLRKLEGGHYGVQASPEEWRTVWLWIESGAVYAGSYAGLRNQERQADEGRALGRVMGRSGEILRRRCFSCHNSKEGSRAMAIPYNQEEQRKANRALLGQPTGIHERIVIEDDPVARFGAQILVNLSRPRLSALLLGPLAVSAGGYGSCGQVVFETVDDPDYQALLAAIEGAQGEANDPPRYGAEGFEPNPQYVREMKRFGVLPADFELGRDPIDHFETDQRYWRSLWSGGEARTPAKP